MPRTPLTRRQGGLLVKIVVIGLLVNLGVIGYVFGSNYAARKSTVAGQRFSCERNKLDRKANASGWRIAQEARRKSGDISIAIRYGNLARGLERRARLDCKKTYPKARLFP